MGFGVVMLVFLINPSTAPGEGLWVIRQVAIQVFCPFIKLDKSAFY